jgi:hypothetical protein
MGDLLARGYVVCSHPSTCGKPVAYDTLGFGSRGGLFPRRLERRWTEDLYSVGVALGSRPEAIQSGGLPASVSSVDGSLASL